MRMMFLASMCVVIGFASTFAGSLTGWMARTDSVNNLTALGTLDWVSWHDTLINGSSGTIKVIRKAGGNKIGTLTAAGGQDNDTNHQALHSRFTWSDGTPLTSSPPNYGKATAISGNFSFTVPADPTVRTLTVFCCTYNTSGAFTAHLSDGSAPDYVDASIVPDLGDGFEAAYTIVYSANSANQTLKISFEAGWPGSWCSQHMHAAVLRDGASTQPPGQLPAPTGLQARPGNGVVTLVFPRVQSAHSYNVYRSTTAGSTGTTPATTGVVAFNCYLTPASVQFLADYGDYGLTNGTTYSYQITAVTGTIESPKSNLVTATPAAAPWQITHKRFIKVLPMGNSICGGWPTYTGGWRPTLQDSLKSGGYNFRIVGSMTWPYTLPDTGFGQPYHEGYGSRTVAHIRDGVIRRALTSYDPDAVLLEIGTNNFAWITPTDQDVQTALKDYDSLLSIVFALKPNCNLLVAPIMPLSGGKDAQVNAFNAGLKSKVQTFAQKGMHVTYVSEMETITSGQIGDGVHPAPETYPIVGAIWYRAIKAITNDAATTAEPAAASGTRGALPRVETRGGVISVLSTGANGFAVRIFTPRGAQVSHAVVDGQNGRCGVTRAVARGAYVVEVTVKGAPPVRQMTIVR